MSKGLVVWQYLKNIAIAIRNGNGTQNKYKPSEMADGIYDITYHIVPVQITNVVVTPGQYITTYTYTYSIVNDLPNEYPNLLYTGTLDECSFQFNNRVLTINKSQYHEMIIPSVIILNSDTFDENNIVADNCVSFTDPRLVQTYAIYGKRKGGNN